MQTDQQNKINGYHLRLTDKGHWSLFCRGHDKETELASGDLAIDSGPGKWHRMALNFKDYKITAVIDGTMVAKDIADSTYAPGLVGYQVSRWQNAQFMNFEVLPVQ